MDNVTNPTATIELRPYQREALDAVEAAAARGIQRVAVALPTGAGKTVIFAELVRRRGGRALVLAHRDELIAQAAEKVRRVHPWCRVGIVKAGRDEVVDADVVVASVQTLARRARLARLGRDFRTVVVDEVAAEVVDAMQAQARRQDVRLALHVEGRPPQIVLDAGRIERAAANLVRNALEHTPPGGRVDVRVVSGGDALQMQVIDTGEGIDERDLPRVWERFYRAEKSRSRVQENLDGAGLGLAIVRGVIEAHGGTVEVTSTPQRGTVFTARLPLRR